MSQTSEVEQLRALLERSEREKRDLLQQLSKAQSYATSTAPSFDVSHVNYPIPPQARAPFGNHGQPNNGTRAPSAATDSRSRPQQVQLEQSRPMKRSKTTHAVGSSTTAPMMRSSSSISRPAPNPNPFGAKGPGPIPGPVMQHSLPVASSGGFNDHVLQDQVQYPTDTFIHDVSSMVGRELGVAEFLNMHTDDLFSTASPINIPQSTTLSPSEPEQYPSSSFPSICGSLTSGQTLETAPMSRCNSSMNDGASISGQFSEMVRIQSQQSAGALRPSPISLPPPLLGKRSSEDSGVAAMRGDSFHGAYPSSAPTRSFLAQHHHPMEPSLSQSSIKSTSSDGLSPHDLNSPFLAQHLSMERSVSKDSVKSNSSLKLRAKVALTRQNNAAKSRHLQPKPAADAIKQEPKGAAGNTAKDGKTAITKTKYERPKHPKVLCNQCNDHPEGFRGEHELRRHTEAKHKSMVKKWICRDPDAYGIAHAETAVKPLKDCKQCSQSKQYGAYYNAAAHLRRTHFKVKPRKGAASAKNGQNKADEEKEKRGGKGGGDWPSMSELKLWMVEVTVPMDQAGALVPDGTESVGAVEAEDFDNEFADSQYNSQASHSMSLGADDFGINAFAGVGEGFSQTIDLSGISLLAGSELDSQQSGMYTYTNPVLPAPPLHGAPISSAGFDYTNSNLATHQQSHMAAASLMGLDSHGYTSPVSSTATITQAAAYVDQLIPPPPPAAAAAGVMQPQGDDLADMPFDLTFTASQ